MILFPPSKINLGLHVLNKRKDGYHNIETCMYPIPLYDVLEIIPASEFSFKQSGLEIDAEIDDNLIVRAYNLLKEKFDLPEIYIHLRKNIPMGAGLGGGSADASFTLLGLNEMFNLKLSKSELVDISAELGSDCPFFIKSKAQFAKGRGEILEDLALDLNGYFLKVINPGIHVGTSEAYSNLNFGGSKEELIQVLNSAVKSWKSSLVNDFEDSIFKKHPSLSDIKNELYSNGAEYASMTGSGSTIFGLFKSKPDKTPINKNEWVLKL